MKKLDNAIFCSATLAGTLFCWTQGWDSFGVFLAVLFTIVAIFG